MANFFVQCHPDDININQCELAETNFIEADSSTMKRSTIPGVICGSSDSKNGRLFKDLNKTEFCKD